MGKYFTIKELSRSETADKKGIKNVPGAKEVECLNKLIDKVLDPLRTAYGKPITVTSGYRCPMVNRLVGGTPTSHHVYGCAADIKGASKAENKKLFQLAQSLKLPYCQLIDEYGYSWVHVSYVETNVKRQILHIS